MMLPWSKWMYGHWHWSREDASWDLRSKDGSKSFDFEWGFLFYWRVCTRPWQALSPFFTIISSGPVSQSIYRFDMYALYGSIVWELENRFGRCVFFFFFLNFRICICILSTAVCWPIMHWSSGQNKDGHNLTPTSSIRRHQLSLFSSLSVSVFLVFVFWFLVFGGLLSRQKAIKKASKEQKAEQSESWKRIECCIYRIGGLEEANPITGSLSGVNEWVTSAP